MKTRALENYGASVGLEVYDVDWQSPEEVTELGRLAASQCIIFLDKPPSYQEMTDHMNTWGDVGGATMFDYIINKKIDGRHWREIYLALGYTTTGVEKDLLTQVTMVTYKKDSKGRAQGAFSNGELHWHSDQCAFDDAQRIIGLMSISDTANSQTTFLCTHDAYESLSSDMRSTVKELVVKHKWRDGVMAPGLNSAQTLMVHYNMVPLDGMETQLYRETASGLSGMKIPSHSFDGFAGMSMDESNRIMSELKKVVFQEKYVYTRNWQDNQMVFMDQEITLHARPTNVLDGDKRTMARLINYVNKIYPDNRRTYEVRYDGRTISHDDLVTLVDKDRQYKFEVEQQRAYVPINDHVYAN